MFKTNVGLNRSCDPVLSRYNLSLELEKRKKKTYFNVKPDSKKDYMIASVRHFFLRWICARGREGS